MAEDAAPRTEGERNTVRAPERLFQPGEEAYRYKLKAPTFTGQEDVEQFITEFSEVLAITKWPPRVALIKLRRALTEQAKPYGLGSSVNEIFTALRGRLGISAVDAKACLQGLLRRKHTPLQDHATIVIRLALIAYSDLPEQHQQNYTFDVFVQFINDLGLHHQLQARGVTTIEAALQEGEAYLQAERLYRVTQSSQQVTTEPNHLDQTVAADTTLSLEAEIDRLMTMLKWLIATLAPTSPVRPTRRPSRPKVGVPRPTALCWRCGARGHLHSSCPQPWEPGTFADGSRIPFYGIIELTGRVRDQAIQETFVISQLEEDAILGMPFLKRHGCRIDFHKSAMLMAGKELTCVDKSGCPLAGGVQVVRNCTIPGRPRATIHCRVNDSQISGLGVVKGVHTRIQLASSLNRLTERGEILVQCVNPFSEAVTLLSGSMLGRFHSV